MSTWKTTGLEIKVTSTGISAAKKDQKELRVELSGTIKAVDKLENKFRKYDTGAKRAGAGTKKLRASLDALKSAVAALGLYKLVEQFKRMGEYGLQTAMTFERLGVQMETVMGSMAGGERAMAWMERFIMETPFQLKDATTAFVQLKAMGMDPMNGSMQAIADATAKLGGDMVKMERITQAVGKAWTKNKFQGYEFIQMTRAGVPAVDLFSKAIGKTGSEVYEMSRKGQLGRKEINLFLAELGKWGEGASAALMTTFGGAVSNLVDAVDISIRRFAVQSGLLGDLAKEVKKLETQIMAFGESKTLQKWADDTKTGLYNLISGFKDLGGAISDVAGGSSDAMGPFAKITQEFKEMGEQVQIVTGFWGNLRDSINESGEAGAAFVSGGEKVATFFSSLTGDFTALYGAIERYNTGSGDIFMDDDVELFNRLNAAMKEVEGKTIPQLLEAQRKEGIAVHKSAMEWLQYYKNQKAAGTLSGKMLKAHNQLTKATKDEAAAVKAAAEAEDERIQHQAKLLGFLQEAQELLNEKKTLWDKLKDQEHERTIAQMRLNEEAEKLNDTQMEANFLLKESIEIDRQKSASTSTVASAYRALMNPVEGFMATLEAWSKTPVVPLPTPGPADDPELAKAAERIEKNLEDAAKRSAETFGQTISDALYAVFVDEDGSLMDVWDGLVQQMGSNGADTIGDAFRSAFTGGGGGVTELLQSFGITYTAGEGGGAGSFSFGGGEEMWRAAAGLAGAYLQNRDDPSSGELIGGGALSGYASGGVWGAIGGALMGMYQASSRPEDAMGAFSLNPEWMFAGPGTVPYNVGPGGFTPDMGEEMLDETALQVFQDNWSNFWAMGRAFRNVVQGFGDPTLLEGIDLSTALGMIRFDASSSELTSALTETFTGMWQGVYGQAIEQGFSDLFDRVYGVQDPATYGQMTPTQHMDARHEALPFGYSENLSRFQRFWEQFSRELANLPADERLEAMTTMIGTLSMIADLRETDLLEDLARSSAENFQIFVDEAAEQVSVLSSGWEGMGLIDRAGELQNIGAIWQTVLEGARQMLAQIQAAQDQMNASFDSARERLAIGGMSDTEKEQYFIDQVNAAMAAIGTATSVEDVQSATSDVLRYVQMLEQLYQSTEQEGGSLYNQVFQDIAGGPFGLGISSLIEAAGMDPASREFSGMTVAEILSDILGDAQELANEQYDALRGDVLDNLDTFEQQVLDAADALLDFTEAIDMWQADITDAVPGGTPGDPFYVVVTPGGRVSPWGGDDIAGDDIAGAIPGAKPGGPTPVGGGGKTLSDLIDAMQADDAIRVQEMQSYRLMLENMVNSIASSIQNGAVPVVNVSVEGSIAALKPMVRAVVNEMSQGSGASQNTAIF